MTRQIDRMTCRVLRQALQTARSWVWVTRTCGEFPALVGSKIIRMTARVVLLQPPRHIGAYQLCHRGASAFGDSFQHLSVVMIEPDKLVMPALFGLAVLPPPVPHGCPSGAPSMVRRGCQRGPGGNIPNGAPVLAQPIAVASSRRARRYLRISSARACRVASGSPASNSVMTITRCRRMRQYATDKAKWDQLQYKWEEATNRTHAPQQTTHGLHGVTQSPRRRAA